MKISLSNLSCVSLYRDHYENKLVKPVLCIFIWGATMKISLSNLSCVPLYRVHYENKVVKPVSVSLYRDHYENKLIKTCLVYLYIGSTMKISLFKPVLGIFIQGPL